MKVIYKLSSAPYVMCVCVCAWACTRVYVSAIIISIHLVVKMYWSKEKRHLLKKQECKK